MSEISQSTIPSLGREIGPIRTLLPSRPTSFKHRDPTTNRATPTPNGRARSRLEGSMSPQSRASQTDSEAMPSNKGRNIRSTAGEASAKPKSDDDAAGQGGQICRLVVDGEKHVMLRFCSYFLTSIATAIRPKHRYGGDHPKVPRYVTLAASTKKRGIQPDRPI